MTMTNDERREVADGLRYVAEHGAPEWATTACCIAECIGEDDYPLWNGSGLLFSKLADLIEPEKRTCHDVSFDSREFVCSWCGCHIDVLGIESEPTMWLGGSPIEPSFCPNCGAKVVDV